jgi:tetratricopeptide (TPR) repeat protein
MNARSCGYGLLPVLGVLLLTAGAGYSAGGTDTLAEIEKALTADNCDWQTVLARCGAVDEKSSAVVRAIKGHACLALNENDESLRLFLSLTNEADQKAWHKWATGFAERVQNDPKSKPAAKAICKYLEGDSWARLGRWENATRCHSEATKLDGRGALAWNALGVACIYFEKTPSQEALAKARRCFETARDLSPTFADAHANLGTYYLMIEGAPEAATEFDAALVHSKHFAMARIGCACTKLARRRNAEGLQAAIAELQVAARSPSAQPIVEENLKILTEVASGASDQRRAGRAARPGTTIGAEYRQLLTAYRGNPIAAEGMLRNMTTNEVQSLLNKSTTSHFFSESAARVQGIYTGRAEAMREGRISLGIPLPGGRIVGAEGSGRNTIEVQASGLRAADRSLQDARDHAGFGAMMTGELNRRGVGVQPGGGTTKGTALREALGDLGAWPMKFTRFGLAPQVSLPKIRTF